MIKPYRNGTLLRLYIRPAASKTSWDKVFDDRQKVKIAAPPEDGKANEELVRFVAKSFSIPKSKVQIIRGESSKLKDLYLDLEYGIALEAFKKLTAME